MNNNSQFCSNCGTSMIQENIIIPVSKSEAIYTVEKRCIVCDNSQKVAI